MNLPAKSDFLVVSAERRSDCQTLMLVVMSCGFILCDSRTREKNDINLYEYYGRTHHIHNPQELAQVISIQMH